jgi:hypothetical protein
MLTRKRSFLLIGFILINSFFVTCSASWWNPVTWVGGGSSSGSQQNDDAKIAAEKARIAAQKAEAARIADATTRVLMEKYWDAASKDVASLRIGDCIKLKHKLNNLSLKGLADKKYFHTNSSMQNVVCTDTVGDWWIVKGAHGVTRWTGSIGLPVAKEQVIRLEHVDSGMMLHSHKGVPSPMSKQQEVTLFGENGFGDSNDNWKITDVADGLIKKGSVIKLVHVATNHALHAHSFKLITGEGEVTGYSGRDTNDFWIIEDIIPAAAKDFDIVFSVYGDINSSEDKKGIAITNVLDELTTNGVLRFPTVAIEEKPNQTPSYMYKTLNVADPAPGTLKGVTVIYRADNALWLHIASEFSPLTLPDARDVRIFEIKDNEKLLPGMEVLYAAYGDFNCAAIGKANGAGLSKMQIKDVTQKVRSLEKNEKIVFAAGSKNTLFGDPAPGISKSLLIVFRLNNRIYAYLSGEDEAGVISEEVAKDVPALFEVKVTANLPEGFFPQAATASRLAVGSRNDKLMAFSLSLYFDELRQFNLASMDPNPWKKFVAKDQTGKEITSFDDVSFSSDGVLCILDGDGKAFKYDWEKGLFIPLLLGAGNENLVLSQISVGNNEDIWAVDEDNDTIYEYGKDGWEKRDRGNYVAAGVDGTVMALNVNNELFEYKDGGWVFVPDVKFSSITVGSKDHVYGTFEGQLWTRDADGKWIQLKDKDDKPVDNIDEISVNAAGSVMVTDFDDDIYHKGSAGFAITRIEPAKEPGEKQKIEGKVAPAPKGEPNRLEAQEKGKIVVDKAGQEKARVKEERSAKERAKKKGKKIDKKKMQKRSAKKSKKAEFKKARKAPGTKMVGGKPRRKPAISRSSQAQRRTTRKAPSKQGVKRKTKVQKKPAIRKPAKKVTPKAVEAEGKETVATGA